MSKDKELAKIEREINAENLAREHAAKARAYRAYEKGLEKELAETKQKIAKRENKSPEGKLADAKNTIRDIDQLPKADNLVHIPFAKIMEKLGISDKKFGSRKKSKDEIGQEFYKAIIDPKNAAYIKELRVRFIDTFKQIVDLVLSTAKLTLDKEKSLIKQVTQDLGISTKKFLIVNKTREEIAAEIEDALSFEKNAGVAELARRILNLKENEGVKKRLETFDEELYQSLTSVRDFWPQSQVPQSITPDNQVIELKHEKLHESKDSEERDAQPDKAKQLAGQAAELPGQVNVSKPESKVNSMLKQPAAAKKPNLNDIAQGNGAGASHQR